MIEVLKQALAHAKLNERHQTVAESYYWLRQYKLLAEKAIAELESQKALTHPPQRTEPLIGCVNHDCAKCKEKNSV